MSRKKILLGGVPFGCNNIGDEAILSMVVNIVKDVCPEASITVSTGCPVSTSKLLDVDTCPLFGFDGTDNYRRDFEAELQNVDTYIWSGATGLSDYPDVSLDLLEIAQGMGKQTIVFCTGMNDSLNPAHFKLLAGKKYQLFSSMTSVLRGKFDFVDVFEKLKESRLRLRLKKVLDRCDLIISRDCQSRDQLMRSHLAKNPVVAADPAIALPLVEPTEKLWGQALMEFVRSPDVLLGVCISSQQNLLQADEFAHWLDHIVARKNARIVFIPMNPLTDFEVMANIRGTMVHKSSTIIARGTDSPEAVAGLAAKMNVIISSRLHLIIFASISATPCIGIGRGSKVNNFLSEFGQQVAGSTDNIHFDEMEYELDHLLGETQSYKEKAFIARERMLYRLGVAKRELGSVLS